MGGISQGLSKMRMVVKTSCLLTGQRVKYRKNSENKEQKTGDFAW
jgi:hypothetical protein